ncbi:hypothetical protein CWRG_00219 [Chthonomonas calidirosea]|uniref:hypothetical protein n=1 Tax=Chthonomonas calidirosea TaxID=454171 RepID=UPI0006DD46AF|nr:hypothetical protein [Chthonomonas calidirosea]CEK12823.1 hypothetical protein CWRG_00219 [Chthonomonas calidirosea]
MPTIQELFAQLVRQEADHLIRHAEATPPDKQIWSPLDKGRTVLDLVQECAYMNGFAAKTLVDRRQPEWSQVEFDRFRAEFNTMEKALARLRTETESLAQAILAFPSEHLNDPVQLPWGVNGTLTVWITIPYWNMCYHLGQVCYVQTLYGDQGYYYGF